MSTNPWLAFLKKHGGKGYSREFLRKMYAKKSASRRKQYREKASAQNARRRRSGKSKKSRSSKPQTKKKCKELLNAKISKNMKEYKRGRYASRQQAIAVSYSQVRKSHPWCNRYL